MIATGGSIVSEPGTYDLLLSTCFTVWLKATPEEHMARVIAQGDTRPMAGNAEAMDDLRRILDGRAALYGQADAIVDTSGRRRRKSAQSSKALAPAAILRMTAVLERRQAHRSSSPLVTFDTHPDRYVHWRLSFDGAGRHAVDGRRRGSGLQPGYKLKLNSYDLGVDIELYDALQRIRFEHPEVKCVVITSGKERMFCSGANIYMLGHVERTPGR